MNSRRQPPRIGVPTLAIIEPFNIDKDISPGLCSGHIPLGVHAFSFQEPKETFSHRIVIAIANPTHTADQPIDFQEA